MRLLTIGLVLILTGTVHAAPMAQAQVVPVNLPDWMAGASVGAIALFIIMRIIASISASKAPAGAHDALVKLADNQAEAIKLDRERFEAQKVDDKERNKNIAELMAMYKDDHERMKKNEATMTRQMGDIASADVKLAGSIDAMVTEGARHNKEIENRLTDIERSMAEVRQDLATVKASVGPNTAEQLGTVEMAFRRLTDEFHALAKALAEKPVETTKTEATHDHESVTTVTGAGADALAGAGAGSTAHPADPDGGGTIHSAPGGLERGDADPVAEPAGSADGTSAG